ncbi:MAG: endolysin [Wendovervirus sonii]|uniref:Endolysin n=1 Tax=phage Lak_Megaphage_Sonny TaxID=3109229 RepID=A0ABZ0Z4D6_9CAUD|nr:MAG: endolysin [phage Lak_Megaphage_Sonny]
MQIPFLKKLNIAFPKNNQKPIKNYMYTVKECFSTEQIPDSKPSKKEQNNNPSKKEQNKSDYSNICIILDPGHAKSTAGKKSPYSLGKDLSQILPFEEWKFNREIVNLLQEKLTKYNFDTFVTTTSEMDGSCDVKLCERATRGYNYVKKEKKEGIFISIHANAYGYGDTWTSACGWSVYTTKCQNISDEFAEILYDEAEKVFKPLGKKLRMDRTDKDRDCESNFTVIQQIEKLSSNKIPAVLIENFFYTNIEDTKYISSNKGKQDIANIIVNAILKYVESKKS